MVTQTKRYICYFDTETTGLDIKNDRVISLAMIMEDENRNTVGSYQQLFNTRKKISEEASRINGLTNEVLAHQPSFKDCAEEILAFMTKPYFDEPGNVNVEVVFKAHNSDYDTIMTSLELERYVKGINADQSFPEWFEHKFPTVPVRDNQAKGLRRYFILEDTMIVSAYLFGKESGFSGSQDWLARHLNIDRGNRDTRHNAMEDAQILRQCCHAMYDIMRTNLFAEYIGKYEEQVKQSTLQIKPIDAQRASTIPTFKFNP